MSKEFAERSVTRAAYTQWCADNDRDIALRAIRDAEFDGEDCQDLRERLLLLGPGFPDCETLAREAHRVYTIATRIFTRYFILGEEAPTDAPRSPGLRLKLAARITEKYASRASEIEDLVGDSVSEFANSARASAVLARMMADRV